MSDIVKNFKCKLKNKFDNKIKDFMDV